MRENKSIAVYGLPNKRTRTIGVIVHNLNSHFIASALSGIQEVSDEHGYEIIITPVQENNERGVFNARKLFNGSVDGVLVSQSIGVRGRMRRLPMVFFDSAERGQRNDCVVIDNRQCGFIATEHLIRQGCTRIAIVTPELEDHVSKRRFEGYRDALGAYGMTFSDDLLIDAGIDIDGGAEAAHRILQMGSLPDGLFITSDLAAAGCMQILTEGGISVPGDIAIVGFNNDPVGRLITPALTTIDHSGFDVGRMAAVQLLSRLAGHRRGEGRPSVVPSSLIVRASSLKGKLL